MIQQVVPIPLVHEKCKYACCSRAYIPLRLSYATALMTLPSSVTPTNPIICDIRNSAIENMQPGFIQRCVSTATTLGNLNGANSSLYFMGKVAQNTSLHRKNPHVYLTNFNKNGCNTYNKHRETQ